MRHFFSRWICSIIFTFFFIITPVIGQTTLGDQFSNYDQIPTEFNQLYIVFAGPYAASPSSVFGHMFLLVEPIGDFNSNVQLWTSINFAANVEDHSNLSTLFNGLIGNLNGNIEILPFYKKIREYSHSESRDLWLFPIELSDDEKENLATYINLNKNNPTQYRFTDKNCATKVSEVLHQTLDIPFKKKNLVLPQQVLEVTEINERLSDPLWVQNIEDQLQSLHNNYNSAANNTLNIDNTERAKFLKTYEWLYNNNSKAVNQDNVAFIRELRFQVSQQESEYTLQSLKKRDFIIHYPLRVGTTIGFEDSRTFFSAINMRLGLHDFIDISSTYPKYDYINLFDFNLKYNPSVFILDQYWIFNQKSRQPSNKFNSPISWTLALGGNRYLLNDKMTLVSGLYTSIGKTYRIMDNWVSSILMSINPVYLHGNKFSFIIEPTIEQRFFITQVIKISAKFSNPYFTNTHLNYSPYLSADLIYNLRRNINLSFSYQRIKGYEYFSLGIYFNLPY